MTLALNNITPEPSLAAITNNLASESAPSTAPASTCKTPRPWWFKLGALLTGLLVGLIIAEVIVRAWAIEPARFVTKRQLVKNDETSPLFYHCYADNPSSELSLTPDVTQGSWLLQEYTFEARELPLSRLSETPWCVEYRHSSKGIRDREYPPRQPDDRERLAIVGDSFVFGEGVPEPLSLPRQLERQLKHSMDCVNGGQVGSNAEQQQGIMDALIQHAECRRVIWVLIPNDVTLTPALARQQKYINDFVLLRDRYLEQERQRGWLLGRPRLLDLTATPFELARIRQDTLNWYLSCYSPNENGYNLHQLKLQMIAAAQRTDARVVLVIYPLLESLEQQYPLQPVHDVLLKMAGEASLPALDLAPTFTGQSTSKLWVDATDHHPNGTAHRMAAEAILKWLRQAQPDFVMEQAL